MEIQAHRIELNPSIERKIRLKEGLERNVALNPGLERKDVKPDQDPKLRKACQEMETYFLSHLLKSMRSTVSSTDLFGSEKEEALFRDMLDDEVAKCAAKANGIGIADMLYKQLSGVQNQAAIQNQTEEVEKPLKGSEPTVEK